MKLRWMLLAWTFLLSGCSDPLREQLNKNWPPVTAEQQRQTALDSTAQALAKLTLPNIAIGVKLADTKTVLLSDKLKKQGVTDIDLAGDKQLLKVKVNFLRQFSESDAGDNGELKAFLAKVRPEVGGSVEVYAGLTSGLSTDGAAPELVLKLLPALSAVSVDKLKLAEKVDASLAGKLLASLLNRYKDNISGELSRAAFTQVKIPALSPKPFDVSQSFRVADANSTAKVDVTASPITMPFKLDGVAWLVTSNELTALVQLSPVTPARAPSTPHSAASATQVLPGVASTYDSVKERVEGLVKAAFEVPNADSSNWVAIRKDLVASAMNSAVNQASVCVSAVVVIPSPTAKTTIPMPNPESISCSQDRTCSSDRQCSYNMTPSTENCQRTVLGVTINNPACEFEKGLENKRREALANAAKFDCDRLRGQEIGACEAVKIASKGLCEAAKVALRGVGPNFGRVDTDLTLRTKDAKVCLRDFAMTQSLDRVSFALEVQGKAVADINVKFTPLDIVGHLTCQFPWSRGQTFEASLLESRLGLSSALSFVSDQGKARVDFVSDAVPVKAKLSPSPVEFLMKSPEMLVACPIVRAAAPLTVGLAPFIKELRGDIDYTLPSQKASLDLALPTQQVGGVAVTSRVISTSQALVLVGTLVSSK